MCIRDRDIFRLLEKSVERIIKDKEELTESHNQTKTHFIKLEEKLRAKDTREAYLVETEAKLRLELSKEAMKNAKAKEEWNSLQSEYKKLYEARIISLKEEKRELQYKLDIIMKENSFLKEERKLNTGKSYRAEAGQIVKRPSQDSEYTKTIKEHSQNNITKEMYESRHNKMTRELSKLRARIDLQENSASKLHIGNPFAERGLNYSFTARSNPKVSFMNKNIKTSCGHSFLSHNG
eukprot:TRINITY_DN12239_c0_g4_i1.p1 TRINITY_DN12239_c0_g4~~TRINITY_DN12239_c0_g4_i1.p1  ORF type:complete len:236 (-),score=54.11 TRINITY_DN12239_c0_g4_i1:125-832(-)